MKKALVLAFVVLAVLALANVAMAERHIISIRAGLNASGFEYEKINNNGTGFFFSETSQLSKGYYSWDWYWRTVTLVGLRKHAKVEGTHPYFGVGVGLTSFWYPTVEGHVGMELVPSFLPEDFSIRLEGGATFAGPDITLDMPYSPFAIHAGASIGWDFDWGFWNSFF